MAISKAQLLESLIRHNYFPAQKRTKEEMPPVFSTNSLILSVAKQIHDAKRRTSKNYAGYDFVEYKATKFNNVPRYFGIPHPKAQIDLAYVIASSWRLLKDATNSDQSYIKPRHHTDGRVFVMDYEQSYLKSIRHLDSSFNNHFFVKTDISSCFPSLYTHALPWALVGLDRAKKKKGPKWKRKWFNRLDEAARWQRRNETQGVLVGTATSNILAEVVLAKVDEALAKEFHFERYIDDYSCYTKTYEDAEEFVRKLSQELKAYNFHLSPSKTHITQLPVSLNDDWTNQLIVALPKDEEPSLSALVGYLDKAMEIQRAHMEGSVIKYAAKAIIGKATGKRRKGVAKYLLGLSVHYPVLIPVYSELLVAIDSDYGEKYHDELLALLEDRILNQCSDGVCWILYYLQRAGFAVTADTANAIVATEDCCSMALLALDSTHRPKVIKFTKILKKSDLYTLDRYWLLLYQLYKTGDIPAPYSGDNTFDILKAGDVNFVEGWI
jgi:hypothetical protein